MSRLCDFSLALAGVLFVAWPLQAQNATPTSNASPPSYYPYDGRAYSSVSNTNSSYGTTDATATPVSVGAPNISSRYSSPDASLTPSAPYIISESTAPTPQMGPYTGGYETSPSPVLNPPTAHPGPAGPPPAEAFPFAPSPSAPPQYDAPSPNPQAVVRPYSSLPYPGPAEASVQATTPRLAQLENAPVSPSDLPPPAIVAPNSGPLPPPTVPPGPPPEPIPAGPSPAATPPPEVLMDEDGGQTFWGGDLEYWVTPQRWEGSVEVGINGSGGNSESLSLQAGFDLKLSDEYFDWTSDLNYVKTTTDSFETQHNALFNVGGERKFDDSPWSLFTKSAVEYDEFKAWDLRWSLNGGVGYQFWGTDITKFKGRFGAGVSREFGGPNNQWSPEAVFGLDYFRQISKRQKLKFTTDFFPEWGNFDDYRVVTNFAWEYLLDEENNLSLKLDVTDRYDSTPNGRKPNDVNYSLLLLWKT